MRRSQLTVQTQYPSAIMLLVSFGKSRRYPLRLNIAEYRLENRFLIGCAACGFSWFPSVTTEKCQNITLKPSTAVFIFLLSFSDTRSMQLIGCCYIN